jgi:hypothetical protein
VPEYSVPVPAGAFHGSAEGVFLQGLPDNGFVNVPQLADGEPWSQEAVGVGSFDNR